MLICFLPALFCYTKMITEKIFVKQIPAATFCIERQQILVENSNYSTYQGAYTKTRICFL